MWIWINVDLLGSLSSHLTVFVFLLVTRDNVIDTQQQDGRLTTEKQQGSVTNSNDQLLVINNH